MSSAHSMNARKCVHAQKPYPSQTFTHKASKVGGRGKKGMKRDRKDRGQEADGKKGSPPPPKKKKKKKKKKIEELEARATEQGLPTHSSG